MSMGPKLLVGSGSLSISVISSLPSWPSEIDLAEGLVHHGVHGSINLLSSPNANALLNRFISSGERSSNLIASPETMLKSIQLEY